MEGASDTTNCDDEDKVIVSSDSNKICTKPGNIFRVKSDIDICINNNVLDESGLLVPLAIRLLMSRAAGSSRLSPCLFRGRSMEPLPYSGNKILWNGVPALP